MLVTYESNYGREFRLRVTLTSMDIEGIAETMNMSSELVDGALVARFIRAAMTDWLTTTEAAQKAS